MICEKLFNAWTYLQKVNDPELTLDEYVNATRVVAIGNLQSVVQWAIDGGGEFAPSPGDVIERSATYYHTKIKPPDYNPAVTIAETIESRVDESVRSYASRRLDVLPIGEGPTAQKDGLEIVGKQPEVRSLVDGLVNRDE